MKDATSKGTGHEMDYDGLAAEYAAHRQVNPKVLERLIAVEKVDRHSRMLEDRHVENRKTIPPVLE